MRTLYTIIIILFTMTFSSCKSIKKKEQYNSDMISLAEEIISFVNKKEAIFKSNFNNEFFFHIDINDLDSNYSIVKLSLNSMKPNDFSYKTSCNEIEAFIYIHKDFVKNNTSLNIKNSFFMVPDSRRWDFLVFKNKNKVLKISILENYEVDNNEVDDNFEW
ncbi:hypothetical protein [Flavobacterium sp. HNIBRBA15423]|uniref:hypothetical protein n=1 Tax=Flavobacterium sp. HNIBRBA15423 TaxID=3458683 RepID=UPI004043C7E8